MIFKWKTRTHLPVEEPAAQANVAAPATAADFIAKADAARDLRKWAEARASYEQALRIDPDLQHIWIQLGHAAKESRDHSGAERAYRRALQLNPQDPEGYLQFGNLLRKTGRMAAAFAYYRYALTLDPTIAHARKEIETMRRRANESENRDQRTFRFLHTASAWTTLANPLHGPDFLGIGMARAGTGWLFDQLKFNPDFWMPPVKEFGYLRRGSPTLREHAQKRLSVLKNSDAHLLSSWSNRRENDLRDICFLEEAAASIGNPSDLASYASLFRHKEDALSGDITPGYGYLEPEAIDGIASALPQTKLILLVREPIERAWSRLSMWARQNAFDTTLLDSATAFAKYLAKNERLRKESFATEIYRQWRIHAPNLKVGCFMFDELVRNQGQFLRDIVLFLGANPDRYDAKFVPAENKKANSDKLVMTETARRVLVEHFREELLASAETFGGDAAGWPARYGVG
ncbi:MAG: tetratricopeptide repeat protein [Alphaproteobacteria bacterium]|nr:tetratricopeptide repeat protein [Alphaproteobacteria bacterium]